MLNLSELVDLNALASSAIHSESDFLKQCQHVFNLVTAKIVRDASQERKKEEEIHIDSISTNQDDR